MTQKEVGQRLAARAGSRAYGAPSVLAQLECEVRVLRAIPRTVFHPVPNVDSVLIEMRRRAGGRGPEPAQLRALVAGAFAHRRKTLAGSLALAGAPGPAGSREEVRAALEQIGQPPDARAERLDAAGLPRAGRNPWAVTGELPTLRALAPAKINLGLFLGPVRESDSRHELVSVMQSISLADELTLGPAPAGRVGDELVCPGVPGRPEENLAARALREFRQRTGWQAPPLRLTVEKRIPLAAGLAGGSADAAAALRLARAASGLGDEALLLEIARGLGADVPAQVAPGRWLASGAGELLERLPPPRVGFGILVLAAPFELSTAAVYAEADRLGLARERAELARLHEELASALGQGAAAARGRRAAPQRPAARGRLAARRDRRGAAHARRRRRLPGPRQRLRAERDRAVRPPARGGRHARPGGCRRARRARAGPRHGRPRGGRVRGAGRRRRGRARRRLGRGRGRPIAAPRRRAVPPRARCDCGLRNNPALDA